MAAVGPPPAGQGAPSPVDRPQGGASPAAAGPQEENDPFDATNFDLPKYVNSMFPTGELGCTAGASMGAGVPAAAAVKAPPARSPPFTPLPLASPTAEASLVELEPLVNTLRQKVARVDAEILAAVRQQASSGSRARSDLATAKATIEELFAKIHEIQRKAEQSELMVQVGAGCR